MIRIGFILADTDRTWLGGVNYLSNLLHAIANIADRQIESVLIVPPSMPQKLLAAFPTCQVIYTVLADSQHPCWGLVRKLGERVWGRDVLMERFLRLHGIDVLSHSGQLGRYAKVPTIGWLADFQHLRMPEFFQPAELAARDRGFRRISEQCTTVLLSSVDAQHDLEKFDPSSVTRSRVLHFVAGFSVGWTEAATSEAVLRVRYDLPVSYFHLPNQFWKHKNHRVVIDALAILKSRGCEALVICTGHTRDRRWPGYFDELMCYANEKGVKDCFRVLGLVPYEDMACLMNHSVGVINPSLFEGWSTTVEETKSFGLTIILSDITVHREQNPERGIFFDPCRPDILADALEGVLKGHSLNMESSCQAQARERLPERFAVFGSAYQAIALEAHSRWNRSKSKTGDT